MPPLQASFDPAKARPLRDVPVVQEALGVTVGREWIGRWRYQALERLTHVSESHESFTLVDRLGFVLETGHPMFPIGSAP